jgi:hypothetical protein
MVSVITFQAFAVCSYGYFLELSDFIRLRNLLSKTGTGRMGHKQWLLQHNLVTTSLDSALR